MEQNNQLPQDNLPEDRYEPRPSWQVWGARIGAALFLVLVIFQIVSIARGGL